MHLLLLCLLLMVTTSSYAAEVRVSREPGRPSIFFIDGQLEYVDEKKFIDKVLDSSAGVVVLNSKDFIR